MNHQVLTRPPMQLSHTGIIAAGCPRLLQAKLIHGKRGNQPTGSRAEFGTVCHGMIGNYLMRLLRTTHKRNMHIMQEVASQALDGREFSFALEAEQVLENFWRGFYRDFKADYYLIEEPLACDRHFHLVNLAYDDDGNVTGSVGSDGTIIPLDYDVVTTRADLKTIFDGGKRAIIWDWKTGEEHISSGDARQHKQLRFYAGMHFLHNPHCERIEVRLWGVKYGQKNQDYYEYSNRDFPLEWMKERITREYARVDKYWEQFGDTVWPEVESTGACQYCDICHLCRYNQADAEAVLAMPEPLKNKPNRRAKR